MCRVLNMSGLWIFQDCQYFESAKSGAQVLGVLTCLRAYVLGVLTCLCAYVLGVRVCLRECLLWWNVLFSYVIAYLVCFFVLFALHFKTRIYKLCAWLTIRKNAFYIIRKIKVRNVMGDIVMWFLQKVVFVWRLQVR